MFLLSLSKGIMKKLLLCTGIGMIGLASVTFAQLLPYNELTAGAQRGYDTSHQISISTISDRDIKVFTPKIQDNSTTDAKEYHIMYANNKADLLSGNYHTKAIIATQATSSNGGLLLTLSNTDETLSPMISTGQDYFAFVVPVDFFDSRGIPSEVFCFNLANQTWALGDNCNSFGAGFTSEAVSSNVATGTNNAANANNNSTTTYSGTTDENAQTHNAWTSNMNLANIRHTITGDTITLRWTKVGSAPNVKISVRWPGETSFSNVTTAKMGDEEYNYRFTKSGEYIFWFQPSDGGDEVRYTVNAKAWNPTTPPAPPIWKTPPTWPKENAIAIMILAILVYGWYVIFGKQKA